MSNRAVEQYFARVLVRLLVALPQTIADKEARPADRLPNDKSLRARFFEEGGF